MRGCGRGGLCGRLRVAVDGGWSLGVRRTRWRRDMAQPSAFEELSEVEGFGALGGTEARLHGDNMAASGDDSRHFPHSTLGRGRAVVAEDMAQDVVAVD